MNNEELLHTAKSIVNGSRRKEYGGPEDSFQRIANYWTAFLRNKGLLDKHLVLLPQDVARMMMLLKQARLDSVPNHDDSMIDLAGYLLCYNSLINRDTEE